MFDLVYAHYALHRGMLKGGVQRADIAIPHQAMAQLSFCAIASRKQRAAISGSKV
jgi:hypothetical protein